MESLVYILVLALGIGVLFFAIAFRDTPKIGK
jgi:photosystem II PsbT protein